MIATILLSLVIFGYAGKCFIEWSKKAVVLIAIKAVQ